MTHEQRAAARERCENPPLGPWTERKPIEELTLPERRLLQLKEWAAHARTDLPAALKALDEADLRIAELESALREARCWMIHGDGQSPHRRGAKCETSGDALCIIDAAMKSPDNSIK